VTLRSKLLFWIAALLAVGLGVSSFFVVRSTKANLIDQLDSQLVAAAQAVGPPLRRGFVRPEESAGRQLASIVYAPGGAMIDAAPSGFPANPDPLPDVSAQTAEDRARTGEIFTAPAVEGSLTYRVLASQPQGEITLVIAAPLDGVDETVSTLVRNIAIIGASVLVVLLAAGWWLLRRGLRPLETMATTAGRIADGDLSERAAAGDRRDEVGRLGAAFNTMLDRIEEAFEEQRAALAAKERGETRLRQFVADASHELRTPLTTLRGYVDLYRTGALSGGEELDRAMTRIGTESSRMASLVEDLLLLARLDQGRPLRRAPVELSRLVDDAAGDARALEPGRPLSTRVQPDIWVSGDEDRLRQVVANLMANVRTHTPPATPVEVRLEVSDGTCRLEVVDRGAGVAPAAAERIFDRFYRSDPGRSRDRGGTGLGLPIAKAIVEAHGGTIELEQTPGRGATFAVSLPAGTGSSSIPGILSS
jgi:two-component system OmpR family sensor kinase